MPFVGIGLGLLTLIEQGVITATRAKALFRQGTDEGWTKEQWQAKLTELAETSDAMFADTQAMLDAIAEGGD